MQSTANEKVTCVSTPIPRSADPRIPSAVSRRETSSATNDVVDSLDVDRTMPRPSDMEVKSFEESSAAGMAVDVSDRTIDRGGFSASETAVVG